MTGIPLQCCFRPRLDAWGRTDARGVIVAGDAGGISGARAAEIGGRLVALGAAAELGKVPLQERDRQAAAWRRELAAHVAIRPFLDHLFAPSPCLLAPADEIVLCRCEGVTAGQIREAVDLGCLGPNQAKSFTRAGMGPCQGRICGLSVTTTIAAARGVLARRNRLLPRFARR